MLGDFWLPMSKLLAPRWYLNLIFPFLPAYYFGLEAVFLPSFPSVLFLVVASRDVFFLPEAALLDLFLLTFEVSPPACFYLLDPVADS